MTRLHIRRDVRMPVTVLERDKGLVVEEAETANVGLGGAFITASRALPRDATVRIRTTIPPENEIEATGRVVRTGDEGFAVRFLHMDPEAKEHLWSYIADAITEAETCPYCGQVVPAGTTECGACGLLTDFRNDAYLERHERELRERWRAIIEEETEVLMRNLESAEAQVQSGQGDSDGIRTDVERALGAFLREAEQFEMGIFDAKTIREARRAFHVRTNPLLSKSYFVNRARVWPQGQQGDFRTLENIYRDVPLSDGFGRCLDRVFLDAPLSVAVKNRIRVIEDILRRELERRTQPSILNVACGSCRELVGLVPSITASGARVTCVDDDDDALRYAHGRLALAGVADHFHFRKYNALRMFDDELNLREFGHQDIIYSVGLFDYLPSEFLIKLLGALYRLLKPGGMLVSTFKDAARYDAQLYHWGVDWDGFLQREEADFEAIIASVDVADDAVTRLRDRSDIILFYLLSKGTGREA